MLIVYNRITGQNQQRINRTDAWNDVWFGGQKSVDGQLVYAERQQYRHAWK